MTISRMQEPRQLYGLGSFVKKITKPIKKAVKSPLGKAALLAAGAYFAPTMWGGAKGLGGWKTGIGALRNKAFGAALSGNTAREAAIMRNAGGTKAGGMLGGVFDWIKANPGKSAMLAGGAGAMALPFFAGNVDEEEEGDSWDVTPSSIANIRNMARNQDPSLAFMPNRNYVQPGYYLKDGGIAGLANGGNPAQAQAEQMLRAEYQKYRNQGGTMSYQQFKMAVVQQAQGQGPMAQGQSQRPGYQGGELVMDESMMAETPTGMMEENIEEVQGEPTREELEVLAREIFQLRLEELDEEQLMVVYQAAMEQQPREEMMQEQDVQFAAGGGLMGSHVPGYTTPPGYNRFDYPSGGVRVKRAEGGIMDLGGQEKDYRNEGGFVAIGGEERADDVPARLSKNEFVFTADAVRAAGDGNIDQGAEVMQNMMENLEQGGQISEESQGLGAQGMYDQQQMLQSRMA
jgi:hypothetical protein